MRTLLLLLLLLVAPVLAEALPTRDEVLKAIAAYNANPLAPSPNAHFATVIKFATESDQVKLELGPKTCPWVGEKPESEWQGYLLAAYVVGNVEAQLKAGKAADQVKAGHSNAFRVYDLIRKKDPAYKSAAVEKLRN